MGRLRGWIRALAVGRLRKRTLGWVRTALEGLENEGHLRRLDSTGEYYVLTGHGRDHVETEVDQEAFGFIE